jgi:hypothetical protein
MTTNTNATNTKDTKTQVKLITDNGNHWTTSINGSLDDAKLYFINNIFYREYYETGDEVNVTIVKVELIS